MKTCCTCHLTMPINKFSKAKKSKDGLASSCKTCSAAYHASYYKKNKKQIISDNVARRKSLHEKIDEIKTNGNCKDCGIQYTLEPHLMEFDHISNDKTKCISLAILQSGWSLEKVLDEIAKCDLVCILCHRLRTKNRTVLNGADRHTPYRRAMKQFIDDEKGTLCRECGGTFSPCQLDCDHLVPSLKRGKVSLMRSRSKANIHTEIAKCQILCAVCHRRKHMLEKISK